MKKTYKLDNGFETTLYSWIPKKINAVMQIVHGSAEYAERYDAFAKYLNKQNIAVYAINLRGHGPQEIKRKRAGFFGIKNGSQIVLDDVHEISEMIKKKHPNKPYYLFGHSMGSFIVRTYVTQFKGVDKLIAMGSSQPTAMKIAVFRFAIRAIIFVKGKHKTSKFLDNATYGALNKDLKKLGKYTYPTDWVSWNQENRDWFRKNPYCGFIMTNQGMMDMITWMKNQKKSSNIEHIDKKIKILLISGADDPVSNFGKEITKANIQYKEHQLDSKIVIVPKMRHEILNEVKKDNVYIAINKFLSKNN